MITYLGTKTEGRENSRSWNFEVHTVLEGRVC
jgi:hypothetical protein